MDEEGEWVARARAGDAGAWERLVRQHEQGVFRLAYLMLGDAADAEDAAQETFIRAYQSLHRFDASRPLRPWLLRIVANAARNRRRALGRYVAALRRLLYATPVEETSPAPVVGGEAEALHRAVRTLRPADQEIIYLRFFLELPEAEAAEALGIARGTVKSRLSRALGRLRAVVEHDFPWLHEGGQDEPATA